MEDVKTTETFPCGLLTVDYNLPEVSRFICMGSSQFCDENSEDVEEEADIVADTDKAGQVGDPLDPPDTYHQGTCFRLISS